MADLSHDHRGQHRSIAGACPCFRLIPYRSPLHWESLLLFFPTATKMFQFTALSWIEVFFRLSYERLPYSGILGSTSIANSPRSFVGDHALHRLVVSRYPSFALHRLTLDSGLRRKGRRKLLPLLWLLHMCRSTKSGLCPSPPTGTETRGSKLKIYGHGALGNATPG